MENIENVKGNFELNQYLISNSFQWTWIFWRQLERKTIFPLNAIGIDLTVIYPQFIPFSMNSTVYSLQYLSTYIIFIFIQSKFFGVNFLLKTFLELQRISSFCSLLSFHLFPLWFEASTLFNTILQWFFKTLNKHSTTSFLSTFAQRKLKELVSWRTNNPNPLHHSGTTRSTVYLT